MLKKIFAVVLLLGALACPDVRAFEIMQPQVYEEGADVSGWLMSEKLDGVRGYWDGRRMLSKTGKPLHPPHAFTRNFPDFAIEGEIWGGRSTFEKTVGIVRREQSGDEWLALKFAVFDVPGAEGGFEERLQKATDWFAAHPAPYAFVIEHNRVGNSSRLQEELKRVEELGGEGIILRRPGSPYVKGRSGDILKVKSYADMEAVVVAHLPGQGRNSGRMGSLLVELPNSTIRFKIGSGFTDEVRKNPPPVGALITFKYYGLYESGIPRFPSFLRIREEY